MPDRTNPVPHTTDPGKDDTHAVHETSAPHDDDLPAVAVIGMAGRFPGADDLDAFWENLAAGRESVRPVTDEEFLAAGGDPRDLDDPALIRMASVVEGIDRFDSGFFGYSPAEAAVVDPQQRLLLETAYHALEDAGCLGADRTGEVFGVYAGAGDSRYYPSHVHPRYAGQPGSVALVHAATANSLGTLATRVSYELGLTGPSVSLQTACSTALVAVHTACQDLLDHRCDTALAAAVSLNPSAVLGYRHVPDGPFSPDGHCRAFAADAAGTSSGDGVGAVVLKRLEDALADGDRIRAVIRGSAVNNDGRRKVGFSAPSAAGQTEVILAAQAQAEVDAGTIGLVEAHGTATKLGDPIEVSALTEAFRHSTDRTGFCALGSVKTNIGHLGAAAGIAGLIKAVLALEHRQIPPSLHFDRPNPLIDFDAGPFRVPTALEDWPEGDHPRRAAVSAFGIGGTNAHVILEEAPPAPPAAPRPPEGGHRLVLPLSARTAGALRGQAEALARHLERRPELRLDDVAHSLRTDRPALRHRLTVTAATREEALDALRSATPAIPPLSDDPARVAFLLPGGGTQYPGMGKELYRDHGVYRDTVDECARILRPVLGTDLRTALFEERRPDDTCAFLGLVVTEYALARTLMESGVRPDALIGHSLGEYTAACLAGVIDLADMLPLVTERIRLISSAGGATVGVAAPAEEIRPLLDADLSLAAVNGPSACTVAGHLDAVTRFEAELTRRGVPFRRLRIPVAAHSHVLDPVLPAYETHLRQVTLRPPRIPYVTNVTGTWVTEDQATSVRHWLDHTRDTVRFADGITALWDRLHPVLVEIGPGDTLTKLATGRLTDGTPVTVTTMRHAKAEASDGFVVAEALGRLWSAGVDSALPPVPGTPRRAPLPPYAFERRRHWIDAPGARTDPGASDDTPAAADPGLAPRPRLTTEHVPPRTDREREVTRLWEETLGVGGIGVHDNFFDLGGDSMRAVLLAGRLRQAGVLDVPAATLLAAPTVAGVLTAAGEPDGDTREQTPTALGPLLPLRAEGTATPLFCVHPGAGVAWRYTGLLPHLGGDQPVYGIQAAGLDGTTPPAPDAAAMVAHYLDLVRRVQAHGPYRLLGWSYGGFVAHAMACALQRDGERVELLALLDAPQPHGTAHDPDAAERQVAALLSRVAGLAVDGAPVETVLDRIDRRVAADPAGVPVTRAEAAAIAAVMRNNLRIAPQFAPGSYRGDVLFFSAAEEQSTDFPTDLAVLPGKADSWRPYVDGTLHDHRVPCGHYEMTEPEPIARIGAAVAKALRGLGDRAAASPSP
ncbi:type I polyketide synthase [Streptomyces dubilierae]|uniref:Beta-ketoacyl synthase N-terminal-like domain-containing protein n=1 Tax=Streptomyces dubilierae TaxID=3075533 RepID=A0ABU2PJR2_9ACTN|nr:alpha/beta fold hydrolase [Streptomyces sp. DSM 41921]MDT0390990.1 beta-ketoacyl synthase N-terminal-like domain-containing protein [Streptomyces sp. DSM 41921]